MSDTKKNIEQLKDLKHVSTAPAHNNNAASTILKAAKQHKDSEMKAIVTTQENCVNNAEKNLNEAHTKCEKDLANTRANEVKETSVSSVTAYANCTKTANQMGSEAKLVCQASYQTSLESLDQVISGMIEVAYSL